MKARGSIFGVVVAVLLLLPTPAKATPFLYTISFDEMTINGLLYPADSFSFTVPSILTSTQLISWPQDKELSGILFRELEIALVSPSLSFGYHPSGSSWYSGFDFTPDTFPGSVGTYHSTKNAVYIWVTPCLGCGVITDYYHGSGTLTIADTGASTVPDHGSTLLLFGTGLVGLGVWRKRGQ